MKISDKGLELIKEYEGLRLTAYQCSAGVWTVGYGSTRGVQPGLTISEADATERLRLDVHDAEDCVSDAVERDLTQNQYDACVSLCFNIGCKAFKNSTLVRLLNEGQTEAAAGQFSRWNKANQKVLPGLTRRREAERALFLS